MSQLLLLPDMHHFLKEKTLKDFTCKTNLTRWQTKNTTTIPTRTLVHLSLLPPPEGAEVTSSCPRELELLFNGKTCTLSASIEDGLLGLLTVTEAVFPFNVDSPSESLKIHKKTLSSLDYR